MYNLAKINFSSHLWGDVIIMPRLELIMTTSNECTNAEILCSIIHLNQKVSPVIFFQNLSGPEHVEFFKLILDNIINEPKNRRYTISINTPIQVVRHLGCFFQQLHNNKDQNIAFELMEHNIQELGSYEYGILEQVNTFSNVSLWLDDFGNNQSNFDVINSKNIPFSLIKVSKELFWSLIDSDNLFLKSLLTYLSKNHQVIVEGVESKQHVEFISKMEGIQMQGYFFLPQMAVADG